MMDDTRSHGTATRAVTACGAVLMLASSVFALTPEEAKKKVAAMPGLVAFWDFEYTEGETWSSRFDPRVVDRGFPVYLRRLDDPHRYSPENWPYQQDERSQLMYDTSGPFGRALRCNRGYVFAEVPREEFDQTPLDIHGRTPLTLVAWVKFSGDRHFVAGIWDEGDWGKYSGRRQFALFGGLFGSQGVIAHISATGAASFPQSTAPGSQYARMRAVDGAAFPNGRWVCMAMTFDPHSQTVTAYRNGRATPHVLPDPVILSVYGDAAPREANPFPFTWPIYSPRSFILKFNGYNYTESGVYEHWLEVDLENRRITYGRNPPRSQSGTKYRVTINLFRDGRQILPRPVSVPVEPGSSFPLPDEFNWQWGDELEAALYESKAEADHSAQPVGTPARRAILFGAPFTFGRALGLGGIRLDKGTQVWIDGVAVFNRVLSPSELEAIAFTR